MPHTIAPALALLVALLLGGCQWLLPERFAVNAPLLAMLFGGGIDAPEAETVDAIFELPDGLSVSLYADGLANPRMLRPTPAGHLLVSLSRAGQVVLLAPDADGDGRSDARRVLLDGLDGPHSLELHEGWLVIGVGDGAMRVAFDAERGETLGEPETLVRGLPSGGNHWTRTARFGPDGMLYVSVGSSCNVCIEEDARRAAIVRYAPDGSDETLFATGLRNSVGFDWHPESGALYATDNGRDLLGDDFPPCELNEVVEGGHYGWPFANGDGVPDPDFGDHPDAPEAPRSPAFGFDAHNAPLGITFLRHPDTVPELRGSALVALHGSWNRTRKDGYKVVSLHWQQDGSIVERDFMTGFLAGEDGEQVLGRPVDVAQAADGSIFVSDDYAGAIYRIARAGSGGARSSARTPPAARAPAPGAQPRATADAASLARGAALYEEHGCAGCHEPARALPGVVAVPLRGLGERYSAETLAGFFLHPTPPMPVPPLDASGRADLAAHLLAQ